MLNLHRCMPIMARRDHTARMLQTLGYLTISRRNLHKLVVRELSEKTTYLSLLEYYTRFGDVRGFRVLDDSSPRVAFIYYDKIQAINIALNSGKHIVDGRTLIIHDKMECQDDELDEADYRLATSDPSKTVRTARIVPNNTSVPIRNEKRCTMNKPIGVITDLAVLDGVIPTVKAYSFPKRIRSSSNKLNNDSKMYHRNLHKLVVQDLSEEATYLSLLEYYSRFGDVRGLRILDDSSSRVAFIYYDKIQAISKALNRGNHIVGGRTFKMQCQDDELDEADYRLATRYSSRNLRKTRIVPNTSVPIRKEKRCTMNKTAATIKVKRKRQQLKSRHKISAHPTEFMYDDMLNQSMESTLVVHRTQVSCEQIRNFYQQFGHVVSCFTYNIYFKGIKGRQSCLVTFSTQDEMGRALDNRPNKINDNVELDAHHVRCPARSFVIENLSPLTTNESLWEQLRPAGQMFECTVVHESINGESFCHAYVTFMSRSHLHYCAAIKGFTPIGVITDLAVMDGVIPTVKPYSFPKRIRSSSNKLNNDSKIPSTLQETDDPKPIMGRFMDWFKVMSIGTKKRKRASQLIQDDVGPIKKL
ncbi:RNA recognition motif domain-containing protein [Ditylenchus destructor]|nr:RNA recognition motif domain-containing protein [Ditylenchus destructor]